MPSPFLVQNVYDFSDSHLESASSPSQPTPGQLGDIQVPSPCLLILSLAPLWLSPTKSPPAPANCKVPFKSVGRPGPSRRHSQVLPRREPSVPLHGGGRTAPCTMSRISLLLRLCPRCKCALCSFRLQSRRTVYGHGSSLHYVPRRVDCHARISRVEISFLLINLAWPASEARTALDRRQTGVMQHAVCHVG